MHYLPHFTILQNFEIINLKLLSVHRAFSISRERERERKQGSFHLYGIGEINGGKCENNGKNKAGKKVFLKDVKLHIRKRAVES